MPSQEILKAFEAECGRIARELEDRELLTGHRDEVNRSFYDGLERTGRLILGVPRIRFYFCENA